VDRQTANLTNDACIQGHQYVCEIMVYRKQIIPYGLQLYVKKEHCASLGMSFRKTTKVAAQLIREYQPPAGVKVMVLFESYNLCPTLVKAYGEQGF